MRELTRRFMQIALVSALGGAFAGVTGFLSAQPAQAQAAYGSYVGIGGAIGLTEDGDTGEGDSFSGVIAGRYRFLRMPISIRAQAFVFGSSFAIVPTVSYDYALNWNTDIYLGAGLSFPSGGDPSVVGDQMAFVLQPGIDYMFPYSRLTLFGNAIIAFDAYREGENMAISLQGGLGFRF